MLKALETTVMWVLTPTEMFESSVFRHQICCHETLALLCKECCEAVLMSQCHLQQLLAV